MSFLKKHSLLILMAMLILLIIPMSFAADIDGNTTVQTSDVSVDDVGISDIDEIQAADELEYGDLQYSDDSDELSESYDYETTPSPDVVYDYEGGDQSITITVSFNDNMAEYILGKTMKVHINGDTAGKNVWTTLYRNATSTEHSFTFNLKQFDSDLTKPTNTLIFYCDNYDWDFSTYNFNPLTVYRSDVSSLTDPELSVPTTLTVDVDDTVNIGATQVGNSVISYVSANPNIASVDANGVVTGVSEGSTTITVSVPATSTYEADSKDVAVTVNTPTVQGDAIYVDAFHELGGSGTLADPYHSLKNVMVSSNSGKEIKLLPGTYTFTSTITTQTETFVLSALDDNVIFTTGSSDAMFEPKGTGMITFNGIKFKDSHVTSSPIISSTTTSVGTLNFNNCDFVNNSGMNIIKSSCNINMKGCTFINNTATATTLNGGLIENYNSGSSAIDISYCIFINNSIATLSTSQTSPIIVDWNNGQGPTVKFDYNFVDTNHELTEAEIAYHARLTSYSSAYLTVTAPDADAGETVDIVANFTKADGSPLADSMPDLAVDFATTQAPATIPVTISNNGGKGQYTAKNGASYTEEGNVKYGDVDLVPFTFEVTGNGAASEIKYTSTPSVEGSSSIEYMINDHATVTINVACDLLGEFEYEKLYAWIGNTQKQINIMANEASATVDLKYISDEFGFEEGQTYTIYFHPELRDLNEIGILEGEYVFNPLTVQTIGTNTPEPTVVYTSTPKVGDNSNIDYIIGEDAVVTVTVAYDESYQNNAGFSGKSMRMFINGDKTGTVISGVKANATSFTINLADYIAEEGTYDISFSPGDSVLSWVFYGVDNYVVELNNLTVNAVNPGASSSYISTPVPSSVDYTIGESLKVTVNVEYDSYFEDDLADLSVFVYINGENTANRVKINGVYADATNFEFDLVSIADKLNVGVNTLTFHPNPNALPFDGPYTFNPLTVTASESSVVYETSVTPSSVDYVIGESSIVTVTADFDPSYAEDLEFAKMFVYINGEDMANRVEVSGVYGNATSFEFDLATIADKLVAGENTLTFHPHPGALEGTVTGDYVFNPLTVIASQLIETSIAASDIVINYKDGSAWTVTLTDVGGNAISNAVVKVGFNANGVGKVYNLKTDANGVVSLPINVAPGEYAVNATFEGDSTYAGSFAQATVTVNPAVTVLTGDDIEIGYKNGAWTVTLTDASGNAISNAAVKIGIAVKGVGKVYSRTTDASGIASLPINVAPGEYAVNATFGGSKKYAAAFVEATVTVVKAELTVSAEDLTMGYKDGSSFKVNVADSNGNAMANINVKFTIGTKSYNFKTDSNGVAELPINLPLGEFSISASVNEACYESNEITNTISVTTSNLAIVADDVNMTYKDGTAYEVQLVNGEGNPVALANQVVKITISGKSYNMKTNANGIASLPINLAAGAYTITAEYNGVEINNIITVVKA